MPQYSNEELRNIVKYFRDNTLGNIEPNKMCFTLCYPLSIHLKSCGIETSVFDSLAEKLSHFWLKLDDDIIIDPTISQFDTYTEPNEIYIGTIPEWFSVISITDIKAIREKAAELLIKKADPNFNYRKYISFLIRAKNFLNGNDGNHTIDTIE